MSKIHMKAAVDRDSVEGKTRTLCGIFLSDKTVLVDNPDGEHEVTCKRCLQIIHECELISRCI